MPTLREKNAEIEAKYPVLRGRLGEKFAERFGVPMDAVSGDIDYDKLKQLHGKGVLPQVVQAYTVAGNPFDQAALDAALAGPVPKKESAPPAEVPPSLPSTGEPEVDDPGDIERRGGFGDLSANMARAGGFLMGAAKEAGARAAIAAGASVPPFVTAGMRRRQAAAEKSAAAELEEQGTKDYGELIVEDAMAMVQAIPEVLNSLVSSFEVERGKTPYEVGEAIGTQVPAGVVAQAKLFAEKPVEMMVRNPVDTLVTVLPVVGQAARTVKLTKSATRMLGSARKAARFILDKNPDVIRRASERLGQSLSKQQFLDLYEAGNPVATEFLEDLLRAPEEAATSAAREVTALKKATKQRAKKDGPLAMPSDAETDSLEALAQKAGATARPAVGVTEAEVAAVKQAEKAARDAAVTKAAARDPLVAESSAEVGRLTKRQRAAKWLNDQAANAGNKPAAAKFSKAADAIESELGDTSKTLRSRVGDTGVAQVADEVKRLEGDLRVARRRQDAAAAAGNEAEASKFSRTAGIIEGELAAKNKALQSMLDEAGVAPDAAALAPEVRRIRAKMEAPSPKDVVKSVDAAAEAAIEQGKVNRRLKAIEAAAEAGKRELEAGKPPTILLDMDGDILIKEAKALDPKVRTPLQRQLANYERVNVDGKSFWAPRRVAYAIQTDLAASKIETEFGKLMSKATATAKQSALPLSLKSMLSNILGNEFMSSVFTGVPVLSSFAGAARGLQWVKYWRTPVAARAANKNHRFFDAIGRTDLIGSNAIAKDIQSVQGIGAVEVLAKGGGKVMEAGDVVYKLPVAEKAFERALGVIEGMPDGAKTVVQVTPRTKVTLVRSGNRLEISTPGKRKRSVIPLDEAGKPVSAAGKRIVDDIAARYASHQAKSLFFDYGDVPSWVKFIRSSPGVGARSPFVTWAFKSLGIPFLKQGLPQAVGYGPTAGIATTSLKGSAKLAAEAAGVTLRRGLLLGALTKDTRDEELLRESANYIPGDMALALVKATSDPAALSVARFSSANWLETSLEAFNLVRILAERSVAGTGNLAEDLIKVADAQVVSGSPEEARLNQEIARRSQELVKRARSKDPLNAALALAGVAGSILFDQYSKMLESDKAGSDFDFLDFINRAFVPSTVRPFSPLSPPLDEARLAGTAEGSKQVAGMPEFLAQQVLGLGWRYIDSEKTLKWYTNAVRNELLAQVDSRGKLRRLRVLEAGGPDMEAKLAEHDEQLEKIKDAIGIAADKAEEDWVAAHERLFKKARRQAGGK